MSTDRRIAQLSSHLKDWEASRKRRLLFATLLPIIALCAAGYWVGDRFQSIEGDLNLAVAGLDKNGATTGQRSLDENIANLNALKAELAELRALPQLLESETGKLSQANARAAELDQQRAETDRQLSSARVRADDLAATVAGLEERLQEAEADNDGLTEGESDLQLQLESQYAQIAVMEAALQTENEHSRTIIAGLTVQLRAVEQEIFTLRQELDEATSKAHEDKIALKDLERENAQIGDRHAALQLREAALNDQLTSSDQDRLTSIRSMETDLAQARLVIAGLLDQLKDTEANRAAATRLNAELDQSLKAAQADANSTATEQQAAYAMLQADYEALLHERVSGDEAAQATIETQAAALSDAQTEITSQAAEMGHLVIQFEALEADYDELLSVRLSDSEAAKEVISSQIGQLSSAEEKISSLQSELGNLQTHGSAELDRLRQLLEGRQQAFLDAQKALDRSEQTVAEAAAVEATLKRERDTINAALTTQNDTISSLETELLTLSEETDATISKSDREIMELRQELDDVRSALAKAQADLSRRDDEAGHLAEAEKTALEFFDAQKERTATLEVREKNLLSELDALKQDHTALQDRAVEQAKEFETKEIAFKSKISLMETETSALASQIEALKTENQAVAVDLTRFKENESRVNAGLIRLESNPDQDAKDRQLSVLRIELATQNAQFTELNAQIGTLNQQIEEERQARLAALDGGDRASQLIQAQLLANKVQAALVGQDSIERVAAQQARLLANIYGNLPGGDDVSLFDGDRIVMSSKILFGSGETSISVGGRAELAAVAQQLKQTTDQLPPDIPWMIRVDGHTDDQPVRRGPHPTNWEISTARASSVARTLIEWGISADRIIAAGFADTHPLINETTEDARQRNRRIELSLTVR